MNRFVFLANMFVLLSLTLFAFLPRKTLIPATGGTSYYVDCLSGNDENAGTSPGQAWHSMSKANTAPLMPGDRLLFKRGCTWYQRLNASWHGTSVQPVLIGAYGSGPLPRIQNGVNQNVNITGSHLIIEYFEVHTDPLQVDANCANQPYGYYQVGFNFREGAAYNTLRYSKASGHTAGVKIHFEAHHNKIRHNTLVNNNVLQKLDDTVPDNDIGAWGVLVNGNYNEFAYNYFANNNAWCSYDYGISGNSIELFAAQHNVIHHNIAVDDETFSELGGRPNRHSQDNVYAYNLHVSSTSRARFLIVTGEQDTRFGPTYRTTVLNNTIYLTAPNSQGVVCGAGCDSDVLNLKNNIIWAEEKAAFADAPFNEGYNIYWDSSGTPFVQFQGFNLSPTSMLEDPQFIDPASIDFRLMSTSLAIDAGMNSGWAKDLNCVSVPQGGGYDIGAYEYTTPQLPPTPAQNQLYLPLTMLSPVLEPSLTPCS